jgi:hypothetical protein
MNFTQHSCALAPNEFSGTPQTEVPRNEYTRRLLCALQ